MQMKNTIFHINDGEVKQVTSHEKTEKRQVSGLNLLDLNLIARRTRHIGEKSALARVRYEKYDTMFPDVVTYGFFKILYIRFAGIITTI